MKPLGSCFLYGIVDLGYVTVNDLTTVTAQLIRGGVDILQLRAKEHSKPEIVRCVEAMLPLTKEAGVPLIINDHPDLLREVDAEGCHVGQEDFSVAEARGDVLIAPAVAYGSSGEHQEFPCTLSIGQEAVELLLVELGRSASRTFAHLVFVCAHGGNFEPAARATTSSCRRESVR